MINVITRSSYEIQNKKYLILFFVFFILFFSPIFFINLYLNYIELIVSNGLESIAAQWQGKSQGIACISFANGSERKFKTSRVKEILNRKEVNTLIFGSSTVMGIKNSMFFNDQKIYNFAQSGNPTRTLIAELDMLIQQKEISHFIVSFDWYLGYLFMPWEIPALSLNNSQQKVVSFIDIVKDSLSTSKVNLLLSKFWIIFIAHNQLEMFKNIFLPPNIYSNGYKCPDGNIAKDFNAALPNKGAGFYPDGSRNYLYFKPALTEKLANTVIQNVHSGYLQMHWLDASRGIIPTLTLLKFSELVKKIKANHTDIFFILPPLLPNLEKTILKTPRGKYLIETKKTLHQFALENEIQILDAGQSEEYGCKASDFYDAHHAIHTCFEKILPYFFSQRSELGYGLIGSNTSTWPHKGKTSDQPSLLP